MVNVRKATGELEPFDENKLRSSVGRAGISKELQDQVISHIKANLYPDVPSAEIYRQILDYLGRSRYPHTRSRYTLKQAIIELGPSGYPFEKYVAALLRHQGYETETGVVMAGKCVTHEIDVVAKKDGRTILVECKFHNQSGIRSDVKIPLYVQARFEDLGKSFSEVWLVTNTKCTSDAIKYAECAGMKIVAWGYPERGNLQDWIEDAKLYPVTSLFSLTPAQRTLLLERNFVLCQDLISNMEALKILHLNNQEESALKDEVTTLCR